MGTNVGANHRGLKLVLQNEMPKRSRSAYWRKAKREGPPMTFLLEVLAEALLSEIAITIVAILLA